MIATPWLRAAAVRRVGQAAYGPAERQRLDIYRPRGATAAPLPVVVFFYGGSWRSGSRRHYRLLAHILAGPGRVVVVPDYRLYPEVRFPAFIQDAQAVLAWVAEHIDAHGGDPRRIVPIGHSAGAHLASLAALGGIPASESADALPQVPIAGVVGLAGPYDLLPIRDPLLQTIFGEAGSQPQAQPLGRGHAGAPPFLLLHGGRDRIVGPGQSKRMWRRLNETTSTNSARLVYVQPLGHFQILSALLGLGRRAGVVQDEVARFIDSPMAAVSQAGPHSYD